MRAEADIAAAFVAEQAMELAAVAFEEPAVVLAAVVAAKYFAAAEGYQLAAADPIHQE